MSAVFTGRKSVSVSTSMIICLMRCDLRDIVAPLLLPVYLAECSNFSISGFQTRKFLFLVTTFRPNLPCLFPPCAYSRIIHFLFIARCAICPFLYHQRINQARRIRPDEKMQSRILRQKYRFAVSPLRSRAIKDFLF